MHAGLPAQGGQPEQHQGSDLGGVGQLSVSVRLDGQPVGLLSAAVVPEEDAHLAAVLVTVARWPDWAAIR
jgi:hypothetical protein